METVFYRQQSMFMLSLVNTYTSRDYTQGWWRVCFAGSERLTVGCRAVIDDFGNLVPVGAWA